MHHLPLAKMHPRVLSYWVPGCALFLEASGLSFLGFIQGSLLAFCVIVLPCWKGFLSFGLPVQLIQLGLFFVCVAPLVSDDGQGVKYVGMVGVVVCSAAFSFTMVAAALLKSRHKGYSFSIVLFCTRF